MLWFSFSMKSHSMNMILYGNGKCLFSKPFCFLKVRMCGHIHRVVVVLYMFLYKL